MICKMTIQSPPPDHHTHAQPGLLRTRGRLPRPELGAHQQVPQDQPHADTRLGPPAAAAHGAFEGADGCVNNRILHIIHHR